MHSNIGRVIRFEIVRNLKKPAFWIAALLLPVLLVGYVALAGVVGGEAGLKLSEGSDIADLTLGVRDGAGYLTATEITDKDGVVRQLKVYESVDEGVADVKSGDLGVFYNVPEDFVETLKVQAYSRPDTASIFNSYDNLIRQLLQVAAAAHVEAVDLAVITNTIEVEEINYAVDSDEVVDPAEVIAKMVVPVVGLALFYILIVMFGNRLTTAMVEEKENRISEIILTSMSPKDLITGKIVSLIMLGFIQLAALVVPALILYLFGATQGFMPEGIMVSWEVGTVVGTLLLLLFSYFLFTGLCVTIGTLVPTAKDASSFSSVVMIMVILPLFFLSDFMSDTPTAMTYVLSYFPPSAPIALMIRNAFGTLPVWELLLGLVLLAVSSALIIKLAVYIFRRSALEFTAKVSLGALLASPRKSWKGK